MEIRSFEGVECWTSSSTTSTRMALTNNAKPVRNENGMVGKNLQKKIRELGSRHFCDFIFKSLKLVVGVTCVVIFLILMNDVWDKYNSKVTGTKS